MPQAERTQNIVELLKWLSHQQSPVHRSAILAYVKVEVTEMGATERTVLGYLKDCAKYALIEEKGGKFKITNYGLKWLERHR